MGVRSLKLTGKGRLEAIQIGDLFCWSLEDKIFNEIRTPKKEAKLYI
jgi:hypothetical protein